jgi:hypothetical protein
MSSSTTSTIPVSSSSASSSSTTSTAGVVENSNTDTSHVHYLSVQLQHQDAMHLYTLQNQLAPKLTNKPDYDVNELDKKLDDIRTLIRTKIEAVRTARTESLPLRVQKSLDVNDSLRQSQYLYRCLTFALRSYKGDNRLFLIEVCFLIMYGCCLWLLVVKQQLVKHQLSQLLLFL